MLGLSRRHHERSLGEDGLERGRGRHARTPGELPKAGWRDVLMRVFQEQGKDNLSMVAAGVAFYAFLAIFPALAAMVSIYGLAFDPHQVEEQVAAISQLLPPQAAGILTGQLTQLTGSSDQGLGWGLALGILLTLWSSSQGIKALMTALNIVYEEEETRSFIRYNLVALGLTFAAILFVLVTLATIALVPAAISFLGITGTVEWALRLLRWPILGLLVIVGLAALYRFAPDRDKPEWRWVSWGAAVATLLWMLGSIGFSVYVSNFGSYDETYGTFGAVVVLLLWFNLSAYVVLLGAELNSEMEHQTAQDTTEGERRPMGQRGAYVADNVGKSP